MSFMYPRTIKITRQPDNTGVGGIGYQGQDPSTETVIASNIPANIQQGSSTRRNEADLPTDNPRGGLWNIFFNMPNGTIFSKDVITDDLGIRYQVVDPYWNSLGYKAICERLEV
jgi:hypothetical protein